MKVHFQLTERLYMFVCGNGLQYSMTRFLCFRNPYIEKRLLSAVLRNECSHRICTSIRHSFNLWYYWHDLQIGIVIICMNGISFATSIVDYT